MNTAPCLPAAVPLYRPWPLRLVDDLRQRWQSRSRREPQAEYAALAHLSENTLRDIGAPDWVHERDRGVLMWMLERARW